MIEIGKTLVSQELLQKRFVCDLVACKGACCVEGDSGAPLENEELSLLEEVYDKVVPFMRKEGIEAVRKHGKFIKDPVDGEMVTPLVKGKECAYVNFDKKGVAKCAMELAYNAGKINFRKPISCHLYPIRVTKYRNFDAVNFHDWEICQPACDCGSALNIKVFRFLKDSLIRKYGNQWYKELELADELADKITKNPT